MPSERCQCGGPWLALLLLDKQFGRQRFVGRVCAMCLAIEWGDDPRDAELHCCCEAELDVVCVRWYGIVRGIGDGCYSCRRVEWWVDEQGTKLVAQLEA